jgi:hypothetical protein
MADSYVDRILDSARSRLPGAIDSQVLFELADVLNEFFRISTCWREVVSINFIADVTDYELFTDDMPARVVSLVEVRDPNNTLVRATMLNPNMLQLAYPATPGAYTIATILTVANKINNETYPRFPQWVADTYGDVIADGLVGRMAAMPAKPFSSPNHAAYYTKKFKQGAQQARIQTNRENLVGGQRWLFPSFAAQR